MKKINKALVLTTAFAFISFIALNTVSSTSANGSGAPTAKTGSPGDGSNCSGCHTGSAVSTLTGVITSDIPATGYVPGATYTVTATIAATSINKFGFEISPQNTTGVKKGTMVITDATQTQLITSGKYITHKTAGTAGTGTKTWSFSWIAPAAGSGAFNFYGAFLLANANNASSGDQVRLSTLAVTEDVSTGIAEKILAADVTVFPNPATDQITINTTYLTGNLTISDLTGKVVKQVHAYEFSANQPIDISDLPKGIYLVKIDSEKGSVVKKMVKQ